MYGLPQKVANVTANGEEIIDVVECGLSDVCKYYYDNGKEIWINNEKKDEIYAIHVVNRKDRIIEFYENMDDKEKYLTEAEKEILLKDAKKRYELDHMYKKRCNLL